MKNWKRNLSLALSVLVLGVLVADIASANHRPHPPRRPGYSDGFFDGLLVSTAGLLISHTTSHEHYKQLVLMGADEEAAVFLGGDMEPGALLREAMKIEREIIQMAGVESELSEEDLAYLIMKRSASLQ